MINPTDCPAFNWTGGHLSACHDCNGRAWEHDLRRDPAGNPVPWVPGLIGYWRNQDLIDDTRAQQLRTVQPPSNHGATL